MIIISNTPAVIKTNPFIKLIEDTKKETLKYEVISRDIIYSRNNNIITAGVIEQIKVTEPKKPIKVDFFDYFVRFGNRVYEIQIMEEGTVAQVLGIPYKKDVKITEFFVTDDNVTYIIKKDDFGNKYIKKA